MYLRLQEYGVILGIHPLVFGGVLLVFVGGVRTQITGGLPSKNLHGKGIFNLHVHHLQKENDPNGRTYSIPRCSMYGLFIYIYQKFEPNVDKYNTLSIRDREYDALANMETICFRES